MTREEKMNKRREAGKTYKYKPNPFPKGSDEYYDEQWNRSHKNVSHKTPFARWTSIMAKLEKHCVYWWKKEDYIVMFLLKILNMETEQYGLNI